MLVQYPTSPKNLSASAFAARLRKLDACQDARKFFKGMDYVTAWATCRRADWLLWFLDAAAPLDDKINERLICRFARDTMHLNSDPRVLACIVAREAWVRGEVSDSIRDEAVAAAVAAAWESVGDGVLPCIWESAWASVQNTTRSAGRASGDAAVAAAMAAARAAAWDSSNNSSKTIDAGANAWAATSARQATIIRELVPMPVL